MKAWAIKMNRLKPADVDHIIDLIEQITNALTKSDFLTPQERQQLKRYQEYEQCTYEIEQTKKLAMMPEVRKSRYSKEIKLYERKRSRIGIEYDPNIARALKFKLSEAKGKYVQSKVPPLQKELDLYLAPRWPEILALSTQKSRLQQIIEGYFLKQSITPAITNELLKTKKTEVVHELQRIKAKLEYEQASKPAESEQNAIPAKRWRIWTKFKGLAKELYGLSIERITKAYLDKYG